MKETKEKNETIKCLTNPLGIGAGCLVEKPECDYAYKIGFSFMCRHPDQHKFYAHETGAFTREEVHNLYDILRQKRREEFVSSLDETSRQYFYLNNDFFGEPRISMDQDL